MGLQRLYDPRNHSARVKPKTFFDSLCSFDFDSSGSRYRCPLQLEEIEVV